MIGFRRESRCGDPQVRLAILSSSSLVEKYLLSQEVLFPAKLGAGVHDRLDPLIGAREHARGNNNQGTYFCTSFLPSAYVPINHEPHSLFYDLFPTTDIIPLRSNSIPDSLLRVSGILLSGKN